MGRGEFGYGGGTVVVEGECGEEGFDAVGLGGTEGEGARC